MAFGRDESAFADGRRRAVVVLDDVRVKGLVSEEQHEGLFSLAREKIDGAIGEEVGDVALHLPRGAILVKVRVDRLPLPLHAHPVVEARPPGLVVSHMPLSEKRGVVAGGVENPRKRLKLVTSLAPVGVVRDPVSPGVETGQDVGAARRAERCRCEGVRETNAFTGDAIDVRRFHEGVTVGADVVPAEIVYDHHEEVGSFVGLAAPDGDEKEQEQRISEHGNSYIRG